MPLSCLVDADGAGLVGTIGIGTLEVGTVPVRTLNVGTLELGTLVAEDRLDPLEVLVAVRDRVADADPAPGAGLDAAANTSLAKSTATSTLPVRRRN